MLKISFKKKIVLLAFIIQASSAFSQTKFLIGYNISSFFSPQRYFQVLDYEYQITYGNNGYTEKGFGLSPFLQGISYGIRFQFDDFWGMTINRNRRIAKSNIAEFPDDKLAQYKISIKTWGIGFTFREDYPKIGIDYEFGKMPLKLKEYPSSEFKHGKWEDFFPTINLFGKGPLFMGMTLYTIHQLKFLEIRPFISWIPEIVYYVDFSGVGKSYYSFKISTFGINAYFVFGNKD